MSAPAPKTAEEGGEKPKKSKKLLFIIIGVLVLALAGAAAAFILLKKNAAEDDEELEEEPAVHGGGRVDAQPLHVEVVLQVVEAVFDRVLRPVDAQRLHGDVHLAVQIPQVARVDLVLEGGHLLHQLVGIILGHLHGDLVVAVEERALGLRTPARRVVVGPQPRQYRQL